MIRVSAVVHENDPDLTFPSGSPRHLGESDDVVTRLLEGQAVDLVVVATLLADVDLEALHSGLQQRRAPSLIEQRTVRGNADLESCLAHLPSEVRGVPVEERFTQPAEVDLRPGAEALTRDRVELDRSGKCPLEHFGRHQALMRRLIARAEVAVSVAAVRRLDVQVQGRKLHARVTSIVRIKDFHVSDRYGNSDRRVPPHACISDGCRSAEPHVIVARPDQGRGSRGWPTMLATGRQGADSSSQNRRSRTSRRSDS